jgi:hypothetical protein
LKAVDHVAVSIRDELLKVFPTELAWPVLTEPHDAGIFQILAKKVGVADGGRIESVADELDA